MPAARFTLHPRGPYSLAAGARFLEGFAPAAHEAAAEGHLHLAFPGPHGEPAGVCVRQEDDQTVVGEVFGAADPGFVRAEAQRILSLDHDGSGFVAVGERDPVVGRLQGALRRAAPRAVPLALRGGGLGPDRAPRTHRPGGSGQGTDGHRAW